MMQHITLCGAECTGKTTLSKKLAHQHQFTLVPEIARLMVVELQRPLQKGDVDNLISRFTFERKHLLKNHKQLCFDTDLVNTLVYSQIYFNFTPRHIDTLIQAHANDFYFLLEPDPKWEKQNWQRPELDNRILVNEQIEQVLIRHQLPYLKIGGNLAARLSQINKILSNHAHLHDNAH